MPSNSACARPVLALALACLWPLAFIALSLIFANSTMNTNINTNTKANADALPAAGQSYSKTGIAGSNQQIINPGLSFRKYLDRVDIMGYGPTHPRVAVVVVGSDSSDDETFKLVSTVESVFRYVPPFFLFHVAAYYCYTMVLE